MMATPFASDLRPLDPPIDYYKDRGIRYPPPTILDGYENIPWSSERDAILFLLLYGTGARINEALALTVDAVKVDSDVIRIYLTTLKTRKRPRPIREIIIAKKVEPWLYGPIKDYVEDLDASVLFPGMRPDKPMTSRNAEILTKKYWRGVVSPEIYQIIRPHLFRHTRLTHLVKFFGFREYELMMYAGWSSTIPARVYVHLYGHDLYEKMLTGKIKIDLERLLMEKMLKEEIGRDGKNISEEHNREVRDTGIQDFMRVRP